jgi:predicted DCC family thiol-disulfide oxidoreductase YuxK
MIELGQQAYMLFDGDCGICSWSAERVKKIDRRKLFIIEPYQSFPETELAKFAITYAQCDQKLHVITPRGKVYRGAFAVNYILWQYLPWSLLVFLIYALPPVLLAELLVYDWVARHRSQLSHRFGLQACRLNR